MMDFSNPNNIALAAILGGGRMLEGSTQPGGTFGRGLANAFTQGPQDLMMFAQAQQQAKMRELQMQRQQQAMQQAEQQQAARQQIATNMQVQAAQQQPEIASGPGAAIPHTYRPVPQGVQNMAGALGSGDMNTLGFLQNQQQMDVSQRAAVERAKYQRRQDEIANQRSNEELGLKRQELQLKQRQSPFEYQEKQLGLQQKKLQIEQSKVSLEKARRDLSDPKAPPAERVKIWNTVIDNFKPIALQHTERRKLLEQSADLAKQQTGPADNQLVTSFISMYQQRISNFDFESATKGVESLPGRVQAQLQNWTTGQTLTPETRQNILKAMGVIYQKDRDSFKSYLGRSNAIIDDAGLGEIYRLQDDSLPDPGVYGLTHSVNGKIKVRSPDGEEGLIDMSDLEETLKRKWMVQ